MKDEELDLLVASVTPQRLLDLMSTAWGTIRYRGRTAVPVIALVEGLMAGLDPGEGPERWQAMLRLREAILATVQRLPGTTVLPGS